MMNKVTAFSLIMMTSVSVSASENGVDNSKGIFDVQTLGSGAEANGTGAVIQVAGRLESAADKLYSNPFATANEPDTQSCGMDDTAVITIYSTNGMAYSQINVSLDGGHIGSLKTYFPDDEPGCKSPSGAGVITIVVPAGKHTLEADSSNVTWPSHNFSVEKCGCMVLPLS